MAGDIEALDGEFMTDSDEYGPGLTFTQAMEELFAGKFSRPDRCAFMYVYAFETVCRYYGAWLGNRYFCPCRYTWFKTLDEVLAGGGVPLRFHDLLHRPPPSVPVRGGGACLGHWKGEELATARPRLETLLASLVGDEAKALSSVREWLVKAAEQPGTMIVGVFC
jgi:hypothetical protein